MPTVSSSQLPPPKNWDEFEDMCADLFMRELEVPNLFRNGRQGQRQDGVDIYGRRKDGKYVGIQCKGKSIWPPTKLTIKEIDTEVKKALKFKPALYEFIIVTISPNDSNIQSHVRAITERHSIEGLFSVHVFGWDELIRRLTNYSYLIEKYYGYITNNAIYDEINSIPQKTADLINTNTPIPNALIDSEINKRLERLRKIRYFNNINTEIEAEVLSNSIQSGDLKYGSQNVKSYALAWCARILSFKDTILAEKILNAASLLSKSKTVDIASAFVSAAKGEYNNALNKLSSIDSPVSRSSAFIITVNKQGAEKAFKWIKKTRLSFDDLDPDGKFTFLNNCIKLRKWQQLLNCVNTLSDEDFSKTPILLYIAAVAYLIQAVPSELRIAILQQIPFDLHEFPLSSDKNGLSFTRKSCGCFKKCAFIAESLGLSRIVNDASDFALWLELRDPDQYESAKEKLKESMRDPAISLRRLNFALQFGIKLDLEAVNKEIDRQSALTGGKSADAAYARFVLAFTQKGPGDSANYIKNFRDQISLSINKEVLGSTEVEFLVHAGRIEDAKTRLEELKQEDLNQEIVTKLKRLISEATEKDPLKTRIDAYQADQSLANLYNLVVLLEENKDWKQLCHYRTELFNRTHLLKDAERLAYVLNINKQHKTLSDLLRNYPEFLSQSIFLQTLWCWVLFREGELNESMKCLKILQKNREDPNDRLLAIKISIASGNWENLAIIIEHEWENKDLRSADELIRAATLAQQIGSQRTRSLVKAAINKADKDAGIFLNAYHIAINGGWENTAEAVDWLPKAIEYSGDGGPVHKMSLNDIVKLKPDWDRRENEIFMKIKKGEIDVFTVVQVLNRSLVDLFLLPALANINETDPRRRLNIYTYSGARQKVISDFESITLYGSSLLTLTFLGVLNEIFSCFEKIVIPHTTLAWLFEEKRKTQFHQPSRVHNAQELRQLIDEGTLSEFIGTASVNADLVTEIGEGLASLIAEAESNVEKDQGQSIVVRSYPVHRIDSLMDEKANLDQHKKCLCSCNALIDKLKQKGQLTTAEEKSARTYLSMHEKRWPDEPEIKDGAILFLDTITIDYLQHLKLLRKLKPAGLTAIVSAVETNEIKTLFRYAGLLKSTGKIIDDLRRMLAEGIANGKVNLCPLPIPQVDNQTGFRSPPIGSIIGTVMKADVVVSDDRYINYHQNIKTDSITIPTITSWELIDTMHSRGKLKLNRLYMYRTKIRQAGLLLTPIEENELLHYLESASISYGTLSETAELKAIRENILQTRMTGVLVLPKEANWLNNILAVIIKTLRLQWSDEIDDTTARARSNWLFQFLDLQDWASVYNEEAGIKIASRDYEYLLWRLLPIPTDTTKKVNERYWNWIDDTVIKRIKIENPEIFLKLVQNYKDFITKIINEDLKKEIEGNTSLRGIAAVSALKHMPTSIKNALISDTNFIKEYNLITRDTLSINIRNEHFKQSELLEAVRRAFKDPSQQYVVYDSAKNKWDIKVEDMSVGNIILINEKTHIILENLFSLLPNIEQRLSALDKAAIKVNLPRNITKELHKIISENERDDILLDEISSELKDTPIAFFKSIKSQFNDTILFSAIVPNSIQYYHRLVGDCRNYNRLPEYVNNVIKKHIEQLISWDPEKGLSLALLLSAHSSIVKTIDIKRVGKAVTIEVFKQIIQAGDFFSKIGAIEIGVSKLNEWPEIEPYIINIIEQIRDDDPNEQGSKFNLISSLIILVDGDLSFNKLFNEKPPFWRRLASIAHAALVERCIVDIHLDVNELITKITAFRGEQYYLQNFCDLRREPRWFPEFISAVQIKAKFIRRIWNTAQENAEIINSFPKLKKLIMDNNQKSIKSIMELTFLPYPGPLEGGIESKKTLPSNIEKEIKYILTTDQIEPDSFYGIINAISLFKMKHDYSKLITKALQQAKFHVKISKNIELILPILTGLSRLAAINRNSDLASELRKLIRIIRHFSTKKITTDQVMQIALTCAASHYNMKKWCRFLSEWINELSFSELNIKEARRLYSHIKCLCRIEPKLWETLGTAEAALKAFISK